MKKFSSQNDRRVQVQVHVCLKNAVVLSLPQCSQVILRVGGLQSYKTVNIVAHVRVDFWSGTVADGAKLKRFETARCVHRTSARKVGINPESTLHIVPTHDGN